jgi:hypothetical protein
MDSNGVDVCGDPDFLLHGRQRAYGYGTSDIQQCSVRRRHFSSVSASEFIIDLFLARGIRITSQFNSKIHYPDSSNPPLWSSDALSNHRFEADKFNFVADNCSLQLSEDGSAYTIKSSTNMKCIVDIKVTRTAPGFVVGKNGTSYFGTDPAAPWGSMRHAFWPRCSVEGNMLTQGGPIDFKGRGFFVHALQGMKPHHAGTLPRNLITSAYC